jgi:cytidylate kinase
MSVVTISRESYTQTKEVAEKVALELGYECISREILIEASEEFNVPEIKLLQAIRDAPSVLDRFTFGKERYTAFIRAALLDRLQRDNVVYHGLAGHHFVRGIAHVLKVKIIGKTEDRINLVMRRAELFEQAAWAMSGMAVPGMGRAGRHAGMSRDKALQILKDIDEARRKWGLHLYGTDTADPGLYDLVIHLETLSTDDAVGMICHAARLPRFRATPESQQAMDDLTLAARIKANLIERFPRAEVAAEAGAVYVALEGGSAGDEATIRDIVAGIPGVDKVEVTAYPLMVVD